MLLNLRRKEILAYVATWMNGKDIVLSGISLEKEEKGLREGRKRKIF